jgi:hypothetical protein
MENHSAGIPIRIYKVPAIKLEAILKTALLLGRLDRRATGSKFGQKNFYFELGTEFNYHQLIISIFSGRSLIP